MRTRLEHRGRKHNIKQRKKAKALYNAGYSYQEIADETGMKSRQLARYYVNTLDKKKEKEYNEIKVGDIN
jgi:orotate phosphoribosyltransferase-like protein